MPCTSGFSAGQPHHLLLLLLLSFSPLLSGNDWRSMGKNGFMWPWSTCKRIYFFSFKLQVFIDLPLLMLLLNLPHAGRPPGAAWHARESCMVTWQRHRHRCPPCSSAGTSQQRRSHHRGPSKDRLKIFPRGRRAQLGWDLMGWDETLAPVLPQRRRSAQVPFQAGL